MKSELKELRSFIAGYIMALVVALLVGIFIGTILYSKRNKAPIQQTQCEISSEIALCHTSLEKCDVEYLKCDVARLKWKDRANEIKSLLEAVQYNPPIYERGECYDEH